jgi:hypothetical protein
LSPPSVGNVAAVCGLPRFGRWGQLLPIVLLLLAVLCLPPSAEARHAERSPLAEVSGPPGLLVIWSGGRGIVTVEPDSPNLARRFCLFLASEPNSQPHCNVRYPSGTQVKLTAFPDTGSRFFRWSRFQCFRELTCRVTVGPDHAEEINDVVAIFSPVRLTVDFGGLGTGTVTSSPAAIQCSSGDFECGASFAAGENIRLTASSNDPVTWVFGCRPVIGMPNDCTARADDFFVGARFGAVDGDPSADPPFPLADIIRLHISKGGAGRGKVIGCVGFTIAALTGTCSSPIIRCGGDCSETMNTERYVTLRARPAAGSHFRRWRLGCGTRNPCSFGASTRNTVRAVFGS